MNNTLKIAFNVIVGTLCIILIVMTGLTLIGKVPIDNFKGILEVLGIPTLFGMIVQSFIHSNQNGGSNVPSNSQILPQSTEQDPGKQSGTGV